MAGLKEMYEQVVKSKVFDNFGYLAHFFVALDENFKPADSWQIGFYNKETTEVETFSVSEQVKIIEKSKALQHDTKAVDELFLSKVKVEFDSAVEKAKKFQQEKYKNQASLSAIVILQSLESRTTWNITFITRNFSILNIKIDAESGEVYHHEFGSLLHPRNKQDKK